MAIECYERFGSRKTTSDELKRVTTIETIWNVEGTSDEMAARAQLLLTAPAWYNDTIISRTLWRKEHSIEPVGFELWEGSVSYGPLDSSGSSGGGSSGSFSFDTTGGTIHVTQSRATKRYGTSPPDFKGAIGVRRDSVEGVDATAPALRFSETHDFPASVVTTAWVKLLADMTGTTNQSPWRDFAAGEVLFLGASGQSQDDGLVPVTFSFSASANAVLEIAGISGVEKDGWEYIWTFYDDQIDAAANKLLQKPKWIYVEQIYPKSNFGVLGI